MDIFKFSNYNARHTNFVDDNVSLNILYPGKDLI